MSDKNTFSHWDTDLLVGRLRSFAGDQLLAGSDHRLVLLASADRLQALYHNTDSIVLQSRLDDAKAENARLKLELERWQNGTIRKIGG